MECCRRDGVVEVTRKHVLDLVALLSPLWVNGEVDEYPACLFGDRQVVVANRVTR